MDARVRPFAIGCAVGGGALIILLLGIRIAFPSYRNTTAAMEPTVRVGEFMMTRRASNPQRGDIIVFEYPSPQRAIFAKRLVALPVLGDNRDRSSDSRYCGTVPREKVRGVVILIGSYQRGYVRPRR